MEFLITMCIIDCFMDFSYHVDERTKEVLVNKNKVTCVERINVEVRSVDS